MAGIVGIIGTTGAIGIAVGTIGAIGIAAITGATTAMIMAATITGIKPGRSADHRRCITSGSPAEIVLGMVSLYRSCYLSIFND
jgi:hypothetical protein